MSMSVLSSAQLIVLISIAGVLCYIMIGNSVEISRPVAILPKNNTKYILDWRVRHMDHYMYKGQKRKLVFKWNYCPLYPDCYLTEDKSMLPDLTDFDVVLFHGSFLAYLGVDRLPQSRSPKQRYVFMTIESAHNYPICDPYYNNFFNWTWTYRLDSDFRWAYFLVYDLDGRVIGPNTDMKWLPTTQPINKDLRLKLSTKRRAAAWFVSNCETTSRREKLVQNISEMMKEYNLTLDIFGRCSKKAKCPKRYWYCNILIEKQYYFYFVFENSIDKDYVTEKLLNAVNNYAVPVVYGGADYSKFLPPGSYLDARTLGARDLVNTMRDIIDNQTRYEEMFRWRNYYQYKEPFMMDVCNLCAKLYDEEATARVSVRRNFYSWWNTDLTWCHFWNKTHGNSSTDWHSHGIAYMNIINSNYVI